MRRLVTFQIATTEQEVGGLLVPQLLVSLLQKADQKVQLIISEGDSLFATVKQNGGDVGSSHLGHISGDKVVEALHVGRFAGQHLVCKFCEGGIDHCDSFLLGVRLLAF